jgi:hypothetical protein
MAHSRVVPTAPAILYDTFTWEPYADNKMIRLTREEFRKLLLVLFGAGVTRQDLDRAYIRCDASELIAKINAYSLKTDKMLSWF